MNVSDAAATARESARAADGRFGSQPGSAPDVSLPPRDDLLGTASQEALEVDFHAPFGPTGLQDFEPAFLRAGDVVELELNDVDSPFSFHFERNREWREALRADGWPKRVRVLGTHPDPWSTSGVILELQANGQSFDIGVHSERWLQVYRTT
jgi:hypothetical protein